MTNAERTPGTNSAVSQGLDREIDRLAASIQRYRVEGQRFFVGDLKLPPDELREKIAADLRRLRSASLTSAAAKFRLGSLEARFQSHLELFGRRFRARERAEVGAAAAEMRMPDPKQGVILGPEVDSPAVEALYRGLYRRDPKMDLERFRSYIERQAEVIRAKTGCREIQFRIAEQDGQVKLKARPLHPGSLT